MTAEDTGEEKKEIVFNKQRDLTPLEHVIIGSSAKVNIKGKETISINSSNIEEMFANDETRKILLSPISLTEGTRSLPEVLKARKQAGGFSGYLNLFEWGGIFDIIPTLLVGGLNEDGELTSFEIYFSSKDKKVSLRENRGKFVVNKRFGNIVKYSGEKDDTMRFEIRSPNKS